MKGSTKLFRIFGIDIKLHFSWWFVFALLVWSLSSAFFPAVCEGAFPTFIPDCSSFTSATYWLMGISATLLLFISVLLHELSHSLVAKLQKIKVESITLFFFGGVASIEDEDMKPITELTMALAGPLFSLILAGIFFLIFKYDGNVILSSIMFYLAQLNFILAIFNLVPGFPLDGGRAFRAILYAYYHDLKKATRIAVKGGKIVAGALIFLGLFSLITGVANGLWFIFLGGFLWFIAGMSYEQVVIKEVLGKLPVAELMDKKYFSLESNLTFSQALLKVAKIPQESFVVKKGTTFVGILDLKQITKFPSSHHSKLTLMQLVIPKQKIKAVEPHTNSYQAFRSLLQQKLDFLPVLEKQALVGIITHQSLNHRLLLDLKYGFLKKK